MTCVGIDVCDGTFLAPGRNKLGCLLVGVAHLLITDAHLISPDGLAALLGDMSWFARLSRPTYSCFHDVYEFTCSPGSAVAQCLSPAAACDLLTILLLAAVLVVDLR